MAPRFARRPRIDCKPGRKRSELLGRQRAKQQHMPFFQLLHQSFDPCQGGTIEVHVHGAADIGRAAEGTQIRGKSTSLFREKLARWSERFVVFIVPASSPRSTCFFYGRILLGVCLDSSKRYLRPPSGSLRQSDICRRDPRRLATARRCAGRTVLLRERLELFPQLALRPSIGFQRIMDRTTRHHFHFLAPLPYRM